MREQEREEGRERGKEGGRKEGEMGREMKGVKVIKREMEGGRQRVKVGIREGWIEKGVVNEEECDEGKVCVTCSVK